MLDQYDPNFFGEFLSGRASEAHLMIKLMTQVFAILIVGIVLWRISSVFGKKKTNRRQNMFSDSSYQNHWKRK